MTLSHDVRYILRAFALMGIVALFIWIITEFDQRMNHYVCSTAPVVVHYGDTIFDIATDNCRGNVRTAIDDLVNRYGTTIHVGQVIELETK